MASEDVVIDELLFSIDKLFRRFLGAVLLEICVPEDETVELCVCSIRPWLLIEGRGYKDLMSALVSASLLVTVWKFFAIIGKCICLLA